MLRLYRKIYRIDAILNKYTLVSPYSINASTFIAGTGGTESNILIESNVPITEEEVGVLYAELNSGLYNSDDIYDLVWYVKYTPNAPLKKLTTRFKIKTFNIVSQIDYEIENTNIIDYEIEDTTQIDYEIIDMGKNR